MFPCISYSQVGGPIEGVNCAAILQPRIQIDVFEDTVARRRALEIQVMTIMDMLDTAQAVLQNAPLHTYDYEVKRYRATLDYILM